MLNAWDQAAKIYNSIGQKATSVGKKTKSIYDDLQQAATRVIPTFQGAVNQASSNVKGNLGVLKSNVNYGKSLVNQGVSNARGNISNARQNLGVIKQNIDLVRSNPRFAQELPNYMSTGIEDMTNQFYGNSIPGKIAASTVGTIGKLTTAALTTPYTNKSNFDKAADIFKGIGATVQIGKTVGFGALSTGFDTAGTLITKRRLPTSEESFKAYKEGLDFGALLAPLEVATGFALKPLLNKISPVDIKNINTYINLAKRAPTKEIRNKAINLITKRVVQNISKAGIAGGVGFGAAGALKPAKDLEERIHHTITDTLTGAAFSGTLRAGSLGSQALGQQVIKPAINAIADKTKDLPIGLSIKDVNTLRSRGKGSYTNIPGLDNPLISEEYRRQIKERIRPDSYQSKNPAFEKEISSIENIANKQTPVNKKVNMLDYFRTPDRVLNKIGLKSEADYLRKQYETYSTEMPQEIERISKWVKQSPDPASSQRIFKYLDGQQVTLSPTETATAKEIKQYLSGWADKLGLPADKRITNYITRLFDDDLIRKEFDEDLAKLITNKQPGSVYNPFVQQRLGAMGYKEDVWTALTAYVKRAERSYHMNPALERLKNKSVDLELSQENYVKSLTQKINMRPSDTDTLLDNFIKSTPVGYKYGQRPVAVVTRQARQAIYRGTLGLNVSTAVKNLTQGANTYSVLGEKHTIKGYIRLIKNWNSSELQDVGILKDNYIQDRSLSATKKFMERFDKSLFVFFEAAEKINRGAAYYGGKSKALSAGKTEQQAIEYAKKVVRDTQFTFGSIDTPVALNNDIAKVFTQFSTFGIKQAEFLGERIKEKDIVGLVRWLGASLLMLKVAGDSIGMEPKDLIPSIRIGVPPTLQAPIEAGKALLNTPNQYGQPRTTEQKLKDIGKSLIPFIPAGTQLNKTLTGAKAIKEGGSFTPTGRLRFEVPPSIKPLVFGVWRTKEAQDYLDEKQNTNQSKEELSAQEFNKKEADIDEKGRRVGAKMYLQLKNLKTPQERAYLLSVWEKQGLLEGAAENEIKRLTKASAVRAKSDFAKAIYSIPTNDGRAKYIKAQFKSMSVADRLRLLSELDAAGLLTKDLEKKLKNQ